MMNTEQKDLVSSARMAGIWYLVLAISGVVGFLIVHPKIFVSNDLAITVANLQDHEDLARLRLLLEFIIVVSQAIAAVYFFKLFRHINHFASWTLAAWGTLNAVIILISAVAMAGAINVANSSLAINDKLIIIQVFVQLIKNSWGVGSLFFGLWLIPMGYIVVSSKRMPLWLGRVLILGGVGYIASAFLTYAGVQDSWVGILTLPATIGEFWMIGYLFIFGIRPIPSRPQE